MSSKTLASALFWELGRFRTRLLERLEKTLKSDNHEESSKALTLLLRFPRGSYISKFLRNLAIDTAMKLEGSGTVALLTLRKVLLSLLAENTTASSKVSSLTGSLVYLTRYTDRRICNTPRNKRVLGYFPRC